MQCRRKTDAQNVNAFFVGNQVFDVGKFFEWPALGNDLAALWDEIGDGDDLESPGGAIPSRNAPALASRLR